MGDNKQVKSILVIDDEPELREVVGGLFQNEFKEIYYAEDGRQGLEVVRTVKPSVIVSDFFMPRLNGLELLKVLKEQGIKTPVIWITGYACRELLCDAWAFGVFDFFEKPFNPTALKMAVQAAVDWGCEFSNPERKNYISRMIAKEVILSIYRENYEGFTRLCEGRGISMTSLMNSLIEEELKKI